MLEKSAAQARAEAWTEEGVEMMHTCEACRVFVHRQHGIMAVAEFLKEHEGHPMETAVVVYAKRRMGVLTPTP